YRRDVCSETRGFDHVNWVTQTRRENFRLPGVVAINLDDVLEQDQTMLADVVEPSEKRTDKRRARLCGQDCLRCRKTERDVHLNALIGELTGGFEALACQWTFDDHVWSNLRILLSFANPPVLVLARHFGRNRSLHDFANCSNVLFEVDAAFFCDERRI